MDLWRDSGDDVDARRLDAVLAVTLLFAVVIVPPLVGVRMTYTLCWLLFTVLALVSASEAARGIATSMGITVMVGWYALRVYDRSAFTAALHGWVGLWATSPVVGFVARVGDFLVHLLLPMLLISCFLPLVRVWMSLPALMASRLWVHFVVGGGKGDHIFRFSPPRSQHFWNAAYRIELLLDSCVPLFCVLAHHRSFWVYAVTAFCGVLLIGLHLIRSYSLRKLRRNAKEIMSRLLAGGGLHISTDFIVRDDAIWLDWMRDGLVAIGETYVGGLWEAAAGRTLDEIVTALMTIPMEARQEMYRSWSARLVALAARMFNYPTASRGLVVGSAAEQFDLSPQFRRQYMDPYLHQGFGIWINDARSLEGAMQNKLEDILEKLDLQDDQRVLDLCLGSMGGVGVYLVEQRAHASVVCVVTSASERVHAMRFADEKGVSDRVEIIVADSPDKLLTVLSSMSASRFERIVGSGLVESLHPLQLPRLFRTIKRIQTAGGQSLFDFVACTASRSTTHVWSNQYINGAFAVQALTLHRVRDLLDLSGFTVHEIASYNEHYERTFVEWYRRFQARWGNANDLRNRTVSDGPGRRPRAPSAMQGSSNVTMDQSATETLALQRARQSLPESFRRTWEFYLLHSAACYRAHVLQSYQLRVA